MFINNGLADVLEGGSKAIKRDELYMETTSFKEFRYTIISGPQHGVLHLIDPTSGQREQVCVFRLRLIYQRYHLCFLFVVRRLLCGC